MSRYGIASFDCAFIPLKANQYTSKREHSNMDVLSPFSQLWEGEGITSDKNLFTWYVLSPFSQLWVGEDKNLFPWYEKSLPEEDY